MYEATSVLTCSHSFYSAHTCIIPYRCFKAKEYIWFVHASYMCHSQYLGTQAAPAMYPMVGKEAAAGKSFHYAKFPFEAMDPDAVIG